MQLVEILSREDLSVRLRNSLGLGVRRAVKTAANDAKSAYADWYHTGSQYDSVKLKTS
jgi:hypothetical protein